MCTYPFAKKALTIHLARGEGRERYFGCNLMQRKVLASSHQHLMAEAPRTAEHGELLPKSDILESQLARSLEGRDESANKRRNHARYGPGRPEGACAVSLLMMCTYPFAKKALTLHLACGEGRERYFGCNLMQRNALASSHQHLMAEAPALLADRCALPTRTICHRQTIAQCSPFQQVRRLKFQPR